MSRPDPGLLMPREAGRYRGPRVAVWFLVAYTAVATARSVVHILAPDSGASSIAGMDTAVAGGANAIALLAQWGGAQLIMALTAWVILWRYRGLVPLMIAAAMLDNVLRIFIGLEKPIATAGTPPGALSWVVAPLCAVFLVVALMPRTEPRSGEGPAPGA